LTLSLVQVGGLIFVIAIGASHVGDVGLIESNGLPGILGAAALVFFAFIGFDEVITLAEETRDPARTIPRALLSALAVSTVLYGLVAVVAVSVLGVAGLSDSERPLADVVSHALGGIGVDFMAAAALISTMNTTLLAVTAGSRVTYGMAGAGALPRPLARVGAQRRVPVLALGAVVLAAGAFVLFGDLALIAGVTDFAVYLVFLAVNGAVIVLRLRLPGRPRPFRSPLSIGNVPLLAAGGLTTTLVMMTYLEGRSIAIGGAITTFGLLAALLARRRLPPGIRGS
jgi:APA family basic amino acid/polyamine antiporter